MLLPFQQDTYWEEPYFCCGFILGLGSGQFIFLFVSLSVLIKREKRMFIVLFSAFFLKCLSVRKFIWRVLEDVPVRCLRAWRAEGMGGTVGNAKDGYSLPSWATVRGLCDALRPWVLVQHLNTASGIAHPKETLAPV